MLPRASLGRAARKRASHVHLRSDPVRRDWPRAGPAELPAPGRHALARRLAGRPPPRRPAPRPSAGRSVPVWPVLPDRPDGAAAPRRLARMRPRGRAWSTAPPRRRDARGIGRRSFARVSATARCPSAIAVRSASAGDDGSRARACCSTSSAPAKSPVPSALPAERSSARLCSFGVIVARGSIWVVTTEGGGAASGPGWATVAAGVTAALRSTSKIRPSGARR